MLDLGTSFVASVARDPNALAIVDGDVRLSYRAWYEKISALVAAFDDLGLKPGDHLVTLAAKQLAGGHAALGLPVRRHHRHAGELARQERRDRFLSRQCGGPRAGLSGHFGRRRGRRKRRRQTAMHRGRRRRRDRSRLRAAHRRQNRRRDAAGRCRCLVADALYLRHHLAAERRTAPAPRRAGSRCRPCGAEPLRARRAHARRDAALPHHGRPLAARHVADRRRVRLPAAIRCCPARSA